MSCARHDPGLPSKPWQPVYRYHVGFPYPLRRNTVVAPERVRTSKALKFELIGKSITEQPAGRSTRRCRRPLLPCSSMRGLGCRSFARNAAHPLGQLNLQQGHFPLFATKPADSLGEGTQHIQRPEHLEPVAELPAARLFILTNVFVLMPASQQGQVA